MEKSQTIDVIGVSFQHFLLCFWLTHSPSFSSHTSSSLLEKGNRQNLKTLWEVCMEICFLYYELSIIKFFFKATFLLLCSWVVKSEYNLKRVNTGIYGYRWPEEMSQFNQVDIYRIPPPAVAEYTPTSSSQEIHAEMTVFWTIKHTLTNLKEQISNMVCSQTTMN